MLVGLLQLIAGGVAGSHCSDGMILQSINSSLGPHRSLMNHMTDNLFCTGPMVWYQGFEYAIGHWLQKATEHVLGCVLCSPGCFSLFRASALLEDNVMRTYSKKAQRAVEHVQYDQGQFIELPWLNASYKLHLKHLHYSNQNC